MQLNSIALKAAKLAAIEERINTDDDLNIEAAIRTYVEATTPVVTMDNIRDAFRVFRKEARLIHKWPTSVRTAFFAGYISATEAVTKKENSDD